MLRSNHFGTMDCSEYMQVILFLAIVGLHNYMKYGFGYTFSYDIY